MPHSGGGGSHGGGHHSGGSHSSGPSYTRGQKTHYPGSRRYFYYYNNRRCYYYSDSVLKDSDFKQRYKSYICFGMIWLLFFAVFVVCSVRYDNGGPLDTSGLDTSIIINDYADIINDDGEYELYSYLNKFLDDTGVIVSVVTYPNHNPSSSVEDESYSTYVKMFSDESHWLIYYCGRDYYRADDWEWNLMCGDDCVRVLGYDQEDKFTRSFHSNLLCDMTFEDAVISALKSLEPDMSGGFKYSSNVTVNGRDVSGEKIGSSGLIFIIFIVVGFAFIIVGVVGLCKPLTDEQKAKLGAKLDDQSI